MKQTEHYQLNQWELPDRIRMEDFNTDNAKLDAALGALNAGLAGRLGQIELLDSFTRDTNFGYQGFYAVPRGYGWADFAVTAATIIPNDLESSAQDQITVTIKDGETLGIVTGGPILVVFFPLHDPTRKTQGLIFCRDGSRMFHVDREFGSFIGGVFHNCMHFNGFLVTSIGVH